MKPVRFTWTGKMARPESQAGFLFQGVCVLRRVQLSATPGTVPLQPPLSMGFSRQEHWIRLPFPPPGDLPGSSIEPASPGSPPVLQADSFTTEPPEKPPRVEVFPSHLPLLLTAATIMFTSLNKELSLLHLLYLT